jgi:hypothetical protein
MSRALLNHAWDEDKGDEGTFWALEYFEVVIITA